MRFASQKHDAVVGTREGSPSAPGTAASLSPGADMAVKDAEGTGLVPAAPSPSSWKELGAFGRSLWAPAVLHMAG